MYRTTRWNSLSNENFDAERNLFLAAVEIGWWQVPDGSKLTSLGFLCSPRGNKAWLELRAVALGLKRGLSPELCRTVTGWEGRAAGGGRGAPCTFPGSFLSSLLAWLVMLGS